MTAVSIFNYPLYFHPPMAVIAVPGSSFRTPLYCYLSSFNFSYLTADSAETPHTSPYRPCGFLRPVQLGAMLADTFRPSPLVLQRDFEPTGELPMASECGKCFRILSPVVPEIPHQKAIPHRSLVAVLARIESREL